MEKQEFITKQEDLFNRWRMARPEYDQNENSWFCEDGIVNAYQNFENWEKRIPKILFLVKEDYSGWSPYRHDFNVEYIFGLNIARWRYLIIKLYDNYVGKINAFVEYPGNNYDLIQNKLTDVAVVEMKKKSEGKSDSNDKEIYDFVSNDSCFLEEQIDLINPNIIICCGGRIGDAYCDHIYTEWAELKKIDKCMSFKQGNRLVVDFFHPSRKNETQSVDLFFLLQNLLTWNDDGQFRSIFGEFNWSEKHSNKLQS